MRINVGYDLIYRCPQSTPMILMLNIHPSRMADLLDDDQLMTEPELPVSHYRDLFGNRCSRIVAPPGRLRLTADATVEDSGLVDQIDRDAWQTPVEQLPDECLAFLLPTRYCDSDRLLTIAWQLFDRTPYGWARVQAICDFVHHHIEFGYQHARANKTAWEVYGERVGVCRDFAHLAITFCRCLNIPARYCTGYLGDIGMPPPYAVGDFCAWFEVYLGGRWQLFDARNNVPRIGRVLIARGRDAADVAITTTFGPNQLEGFRVWTSEVTDGGQVSL
jgi:transglutaminase-like putative cysteine protease